MSTIEIVILCETVAAIVFLMVIIAVTAALRNRRITRAMLYDPYGLYAPITAEELAELDRAAALTCVEARQMQQDMHNTQ